MKAGKDPYAELIMRHMSSTDAARRGHVVAELTALSLLIVRGIATHDEVIERLRLVQTTMPSAYQEAKVGDQVDILVEVLSQQYGARKSTKWQPTVIQGGLAQDQASSEPAGPSGKEEA